MIERLVPTASMMQIIFIFFCQMDRLGRGKNLHVFLSTLGFTGQRSVSRQTLLRSTYVLLCLLRTWDFSLNYSVVSGQLNMTVSGVTLLNIMITEGPTQVRQPVTGMCPSQRRLLRAVGRQMHGGEVEGANDGHVDNVLGMVTSSLPRSRCRVHRPRSRTDGRRLCKTWSRFSWRGTRKAARRDRLERWLEGTKVLNLSSRGTVRISGWIWRSFTSGAGA